jgi:hypothetical protein
MSWMQNLFRASPVRPMQEHMRASVKCARKLPELLDAMVAGDREAIARTRSEMDELEHEADRIKNEIRSHMPRRLLMAIERRDMLEILDSQDSIADTAQDIAGLADQRGMRIPEALREPIVELARRSLAACEQAEKIIDALDELVEMGFKGREVGAVEEMIESLSRIESETDELAEKATRKLFALEAELGVGTVFWYQMIDWIGNLADFAERVGNRLRLLIAT